MKVYHVFQFGTYNAACFFMEQRLPITKVTSSHFAELMVFWVGEEMVAAYDEMTGELVVYRDLNSNNRCYGKMH